MINDEEKYASDEASQFYLLSFIESIDRLDTLLLEARHLQQNIIHDLREPALLLALRYEEQFIWGHNWEDALRQEDNNQLALKFILSYPNPTRIKPSSKKNINLDEENYSKNINLRLEYLIENIWYSGVWGTSQKQNYDNLRAIQYLKQDILKDKLVLCRHAVFDSRVHVPIQRPNKYKKPAQDKRAEFMVLRGTIINQAAKEYIPRLNDYQHSFSRHMDVSSEDLPHSSIQRRREIGIYSDFLYERTLDIYVHIGLLMDHLNIKKEALAEENAEESVHLIMHRWMHEYSSYSLGYDTLAEDEPGITHINTHFWMPERPDLQPIIAHEVAHCFFRLRLNDLEEDRIASTYCNFNSLLIRLQRIIEDYAAHDHYKTIRIEIDSTAIVRELACDFLAASLKGTPFVFAHFLEYLALHESFAGIFKRGNRKPDIESVAYASSDYFRHKEFDNREWYLRIMSLLTWTEQVNHAPDEMDKLVINGCKQVINDMLEYYRNIAATPEQRSREQFWEDLTSAICSIIRKSSVIYEVKAWKNKRSNA